ncbi:MAG: hypothetical protein WAZ18_07110 [Alphaproteobacteria bacterium]
MNAGLWAIALGMAGLVALPAHAESYLSRYSSGGSISSHYGSGSYSTGSGSGYVYYGGPHGSIERKHGTTWNQYQTNLRKARANAHASAWNFPLQNTWASRQYIAWTGTVPGGYSNSPCGTYSRAPTSCRVGTTRYNPALHGSR